MNREITQHLVLDTDIGSDVDDAMTLIQLIGCSMSHKLTITTVYGDTVLRGQIASRYCKLAGVFIPIFVGESTPISGKDVWLSGLEGSLHDDLEAEALEPGSAVEHLLQVSKDKSKKVSILAIGPLTNIAKAITQDSAFASRIEHLYVMGGRFEDGDLEHNFVSDSVAAKIVFDAGIRTTVVGIEATKRVKMPEASITRISEAGLAGLALSKDIFQWWEYWGETWNVPHDPIAALTLLKPELFTFSDWGKIAITAEGVDAGKSTFTSGNGNQRIVLDFNPVEIAEEIVNAIELSHSNSTSVK